VEETRRELEHRGNGSVEYPAGRAGEALVVDVACRGDGTMVVRLPRVGGMFTVECRAGEVALTLNTLAVTGARWAGTVAVEAPGTVEWTITVTRDEHVDPE